MSNILFVDDEKAILRSLMRVFYQTDWKLHFAENGIEALKIFEKTPIDLVISDIRMPDMDGHRLLREVQRLYPYTIRLILSGYSDEREVYMAVLDGAAKSYLMKPWEPDRLHDYIQNILQQRDSLQAKDLFVSFENMKSLPTFRCTVDEINRLVECESTAAQVSDIVETDPGITARLLQLVNSSSYDKKFVSVKQAVYQMGNAAIIKILNDDSHTHIIDQQSELAPRYKFMKQHAILTNQIMDFTFRDYLGTEKPDQATTAGILHNIGRFLTEPGVSSLPHDEVGGDLLKWWGIPQQIVECAYYHHKPSSAPPENQQLICAVHLANYYAGQYLEDTSSTLDKQVFELLHIDQERYEHQVRTFINTLGELSYCF